MQIKTIPIGNIKSCDNEVIVIGRVIGNKLIDASGTLSIEDHNFNNNDIVILKLLRTKNNNWKIIEEIFQSTSLKETPEYIWRLSSIRADNDYNHWKLLHLRYKLIQEIRNYFISVGYIEIDTPILRLWEDPTDNNLFTTTIGPRNYPRLNLRSCPEEYLRRAVIPFFRVFEIGKSFRNEISYKSINSFHYSLPEFTLVEFYETPADFETGMLRLEELLLTVLENLNLPKKFIFNKNIIEFKQPFNRLKILDAIDIYGGEIGKSFIKKLESNNYDNEYLFNELHRIINTKIKPNLLNPTFLTHFPQKADVFPDITDGDFVLRSELFCGTLELAEVGTLQSDKDLLEKHLRKAIQDRHISSQVVEDLIDIDYLIELKRAIPSVGGGGMGIDRLIMLLTNTTDVADVIWYPFPLLEK